MTALWIIHALCFLSGRAEVDNPRGVAIEKIDYGEFEVSRLRCVIGNNKSQAPHNAGYNGLFSLQSPDQEITPYVPFYAGLNLENFFDTGPRAKDNSVFFEPRYASMTFQQINETATELYQPSTPVYHVESWTRFELREPYYIDISFRCIPHESVFKGGLMGIFWASYINEPENKSIYFLGPGGSLDAPKWLQFCAQQHDHCSTILPQEDKQPIPFAVQDCLWNNLSPLRYTEAFYYGRFRNMVLIYIFESNPYLRFAHSPSGGGNTKDGTDTCPAWDFQLVVPNYEVGKTYGFKMRVVYKTWVDRDDVLAEVRKYRAGVDSR